MQARVLAVTGLLVASIIGLAMSTYLYVWPGTAPAPHWLSEPKAEVLVVPAFPMTVRSVEMRRGDTLAQALTRGGLPTRAATALATQFGKDGADLRRIRAGATIEITWNARNEPMQVRYEANPWLSFAARPLDGGWRVGRAETVPELRVEVVKGSVQRSLFDAVERTGESARLVLALVEIFSSDFDFTADTRAGDRFRLLVEKRYAGDSFVDYGRILVAQYTSGGKTLTGVGFESKSSRFAHYDLAGQSLRKSFLKSPLEFTRITSGFTYARRSTTGRRSAHRSAPWPTASSCTRGGTAATASRCTFATGRAMRRNTTTSREWPPICGSACACGRSKSSATSGPPDWRRGLTSTTALRTTARS